MSETKKPFVHELCANNWTLGEAPKPKRQRKPPRLDKAIAAAKKAGLGVAGASLALDGSVSLSFGPIEPELSEAIAPRDASVVASDRILELRKRRE